VPEKAPVFDRTWRRTVTGLVSVAGHRRPVIATPGLVLLPALSPDGKYVAYEASTAGIFEVEAADTRTGARTQVSVGGGTLPSWSADGRQLFFLQDTTIMRAGMAPHDGQIVAMDPVPVFSHPDIVQFKRAGPRWATAAAHPATSRRS
jgi:Tol biopolymer transport system component